MSLFTRTRTNPIFYSDRLALLLADQPERLTRMRTEPQNVDLLTWNVFASLDTHADQNWLAYCLQEIGGPGLRAPVRISLFSGRHRAPRGPTDDPITINQAGRYRASSTSACLLCTPTRSSR